MRPTAQAAVRRHDVALRATAYLPTGSASRTSDGVDPELAVAWSHALAGPWSIGATLSERWFRAADVLSRAPTSCFVGAGLCHRF